MKVNYTDYFHYYFRLTGRPILDILRETISANWLLRKKGIADKWMLQESNATMKDVDR